MKLNRLQLENFKGARALTLEPRGCDISVYGDNGVGKTTIADAFYWLMFGKDSQNRADFEIKTLDGDNKTLHGLDHSVEAVLDIDGTPLQLKKTYKETFTKKRRSPTAEFTGHTTDYFINTVPVQKKEYDSRIDSICSEKTFRMLTDPQYFNVTLPWQDRRKLLLQICGDVSDADVIADHPTLKDLTAILGAHTLEDYRKIIKSRLTAINGELELIPARIDEASRSITEVADGNHSDLVASRSQRLQTLQEKRAQAQAGGSVAEISNQILRIDGEMLAIANGLRQVSNPLREDAMRRQSELKREIGDAELWIKNLESKVLAGNSDVQRLRTKRESVLARHKEISETTFTAPDAPDVATCCPSCGQDLPHDQVEAAIAEYNSARAKKAEAFEVDKQRRLADLMAEGRPGDKPLKTWISDKEAEVEQWQVEIEQKRTELNALKHSLATLVIPDAESRDPEYDEGYRSKRSEKQELEAKLARHREDAGAALAEVDQEIATCRTLLEEARNAVAAVEANARATARVEELKAKEKQLSQEYETLQGHQFLTEEFIRAKVGMLTEKINGRFTLTRFRLFDEQVNGALNECCEAMYNGVPFGSLNHGARVNLGLDVINVLAQHMGFAPPIFCDNSESVTSLLHTAGQQIRLVVSASDKTLRVETAANLKAVA